LRFRKDPRSDRWRQSLDGHQLNPTAEVRLEQIEQRQEPIVRLRTRLEVDKKVHVAVCTGFSAKHRTEQRKPRDAQPADLGRTPTQSVGRLLRTGYRCQRTHSLPRIMPESKPAWLPERLSGGRARNAGHWSAVAQYRR